MGLQERIVEGMRECMEDKDQVKSHFLTMQGGDRLQKKERLSLLQQIFLASFLPNTSPSLLIRRRKLPKQGNNTGQQNRHTMHKCGCSHFCTENRTIEKRGHPRRCHLHGSHVNGLKLPKGPPNKAPSELFFENSSKPVTNQMTRNHQLSCPIQCVYGKSKLSSLAQD